MSKRLNTKIFLEPWFLNKATCALKFANAMYSLFFSKNVFPIGFPAGVFNGPCAYGGNRLKGSIVKHTNSILQGKKKKSYSYSVCFVGSYLTLRICRTIYTCELYAVITNIQTNKKLSPDLLCLCILLSSTIVKDPNRWRRIKKKLWSSAHCRLLTSGR